MNTSRYITLLPSLIALTLLGGGAAQASPTAYTVTDLGASFTDGTEVDAVAVSTSGQALLGTTAADGTPGNFYVWQAGALRSLGQPAYPGDTADSVVGLSDGGQVAGTSWTDAGAARSFLGSGTVYADLGSLGGSAGTQASWVGKTGHVVGAADTGHGVAAFLYKNGALAALPFLAGSGNGDCGGLGVNASDQVVGYAQYGLADAYGNAAQHAALWKNGTIQDLGSLAGAAGDSYAEAINDGGLIVGASDTADGGLDAFQVTGGVMRDLGTLPGGGFSDAHAVNAGGLVVGESDTGATDSGGDSITHAVVWQGGTLSDLNASLPGGSGWTLTRAVGVNDAGQIVGTGLVTGGGVTRTHAFLLTPVSAPALTAKSLSVGPDGVTRLLLVGADGSAVLRRIDAGGNVLGSVSYGPYAGWTAQSLATGPDGRTRVLWTNTSGAATFWLVDGSNAFVSQQQYGPYSGWSAVGIAAETDSTLRALWVNTNGTATVWTLDSTNHLGLQRQYGPYTGWTAKSLAIGPDGNERLLWTNSGGTAAFWRLNAQSQMLDQQQYGPYTGYTARALAAAPDNTARAVWAATDGHIALWTLSAANVYAAQTQFGPFSGWSFQAVSVGTDGNTRLLWDNVSGQSALWSITPSGSFASNFQFGPY